MNFSKVFFGLTACLLAASLSGCFVESSAPPPPPEGSITVDTTIEETTDPALCAALGVDRIEVTILDAGGVVDTVTTPCETFGITIEGLPEGTYEAEVMLLDAFGNQMSDIVVFQGADVVGGTDFGISIDFPVSSIN